MASMSWCIFSSFAFSADSLNAFTNSFTWPEAVTKKLNERAVEKLKERQRKLQERQRKLKERQRKLKGRQWSQCSQCASCTFANLFQVQLFLVN